MSHLIIPQDLAIESMQASGYKDAAHAIAELIDNSIQAGEGQQSTNVEVLVAEEDLFLSQRRSTRITQIAVYDNAAGMSAKTLRLALQFGGGTRKGATTGIGKFGMGLPNASISQCNRVDVYSWQDGEIHYSYLDVKQVADGTLKEVPEPEKLDSLPEEWVNRVEAPIGKSGTLIIWEHLDRLTWKRHKSFFANTEFLAGRIYRHYVESGKATIRLATFNGDKIVEDCHVRPNDPLYLMEKTSAPDEFSDKPAYSEFPIGDDETIILTDSAGVQHPIKLKFSVIKPEYRKQLGDQYGQPGNSPLGKHANKNQGVSLVRAGRELEFNKSFEISYDPTERWWGVEVAFEPSADHIFGVTNNKQFATAFHKLSLDELKEQEGFESKEDLIHYLEEEQDNRLLIALLSERIVKHLNDIRGHIRSQRRGSSQTKKEKTDRAIDAASRTVGDRQTKGHTAAVDEDAKNMPDDTKREELTHEAEIRFGLEGEELKRIVDHWMSEDRFIFDAQELSDFSFFETSTRAGKSIVTLNTEHPAYPTFFEKLENDESEHTVNAYTAIKLILMAWARFYDEKSAYPEERMQLNDIRLGWGRIAREMLQYIEEE